MTQYVIYGHAGDLINCLPPLKVISDRLNRPVTVHCDPPYSGISKACSYIEVAPVKVPAKHRQVIDSLAGQDFITVAPWPEGMDGHTQGKKLLQSWCITQWEKMGFSRDDWHKIPLVFDKREPEAEQSVVDELVKATPYIVTCFAGITSPFRRDLANQVLEVLQPYNVVDISSYRAQRLDHLLKLLEGCSLLVTVDTAILHLSYAVKCPVIALVSAGISSRSPRREHWKYQLTYNQITKERIRWMVENVLTGNQGVCAPVLGAGGADNLGESHVGEVVKE